MRRSMMIIMLALVLCPVEASPAVDVLEAEAHLGHWFLYDSRHSPCAGADFAHEVQDGPTFDLLALPFEGGCNPSEWTGRCDAGGFRFTGDIPEVTEGFLGWWVYLRARITVRLELTTTTRVSALRTLEGLWSPAWFTVTVTMPDGSEDVMLGPDPAIGTAERTLAPGTYRVTFFVEADTTEEIPFSHTSLVEVSWGDPVAVEAHTWGAIKSLYR